MMHLLRVLLVYLGGAFAVLEAVDLLSGKFGLPDWVFTGTLLTLLLGLPIVAATALIQARAPWTTEPSPADTTSSDGTVTGLRKLLTWRHALLGGVFAFALWGMVVTGWLVLASGSEEPAGNIDPELVAVLPFRVAGADASLSYLGEGMVDLMAALLTGEGGLRALDPRTTLAATRKHRLGTDELDGPEAAEVARSLGAGYVMLGSVVGSRDALTLAVSLNTTDGAQSLHAQARGPADSLHTLLDRLTGELLARRAGVRGDRMSTLSTSLQAIRSYLEGRTDYRSGRFEEAARHFARAIEIDSSFVLAASGAINALVWIEEITSPRFARAAEVAWDGRDRLPPVDRLLTTVLVSEADLVPISKNELIDLLENSAAAFPDQPEAWYFLGDSYFHWGDRLGVDAPFARAQAALDRSYSLDSTFAVPVIHLVELAALRRDSSARGLLDHYLGFDSISSTSAMLRLLVGAATDDPLLVGDAFRIAREAGEAAFAWAAPLALQFGLAVEHVDSIHVVGATLARTEADRVFGALQLGTSLAVRGRSNEAVKALARAGDDADLLLTLHALYSDLDDDSVREAVEREGQRAAAPPGEARAARRRQGQAACAVGQWKLWHGDADIEGEIERLRAGALSLDPRGYPEADPTCLELLEAMRAVISGQTDAERRVEGLDALLLTGPPGQR
ncbi:MAG: hypothetical protein PVJ43_11670, partial [Gemmatimonadales bacterium]